MPERTMNEPSNQHFLDLLAQRDALDKQIEEVSAVARNGVIENIKAQMALYRIGHDDLAPARGTRKRAGPVAAKYRDPNSGSTWSGRGRAPLWIAGQEREKFAIQQ
jgi:DNA-binding protein H-NS